jgi:hypothetical protein
MSTNRVQHILDLAGPSPSARRLCEVCTEVTGVSGAGIMLMSEDVPQGTVFTTDEVSSLIEDLQYTLGEGPCVDAYREQEVVLEADLTRPGMDRWPAFTPVVVGAGARAVFGFPLRVGSARLGALNLYRSRAGALDDNEHADALATADLVAAWVLDLQVDAPDGELPQALDAELGADFHYIVQNAAGMVSVQLGVNVTEALVRLRAHAFRSGRPVGDVARDIVERRLHIT